MLYYTYPWSIKAVLTQTMNISLFVYREDDNNLLVQGSSVVCDARVLRVHGR